MQIADPSTAQSLRVMLVKKWSKYKQGLDDLGFLDEETRNLSVGMDLGKEAGEFVFKLRPKKRTPVEYKILNGHTGEDNGT